MENTERKVFRKSFMGGFSKKDVNAYIEEFAARYTARIEELEARLLKSEEEKGDIAEKLSRSEEELSALSGVSTELAEIKQRFEALSASFSQTESEAAKLRAENSDLKARVASLSGIESEYNSRKTELADIEISARSRANEILADAERELSARRAALDIELSERERRFAEMKASSIQESCETVSVMARLVDSLRAEVDSMDSRLIRITENARNNLSTLSNSVSDAGEKVSKISDALRELSN